MLPTIIHEVNEMFMAVMDRKALLARRHDALEMMKSHVVIVRPANK